MMDRLKFLAAFAGVLALTATAQNQAWAQTKWNLPSAYPNDNPHVENLNAFAKDVSDATGGKLTITVHGGASLFKGPEIKRAVATGQAQMGKSWSRFWRTRTRSTASTWCRSWRRASRRR